MDEKNARDVKNFVMVTIAVGCITVITRAAVWLSWQSNCFRRQMSMVLIQ